MLKSLFGLVAIIMGVMTVASNSAYGDINPVAAQEKVVFTCLGFDANLNKMQGTASFVAIERNYKSMCHRWGFITATVKASCQKAANANTRLCRDFARYENGAKTSHQFFADNKLIEQQQTLAPWSVHGKENSDQLSGFNMATQAFAGNLNANIYLGLFSDYAMNSILTRVPGHLKQDIFGATRDVGYGPAFKFLSLPLLRIQFAGLTPAHIQPNIYSTALFVEDQTGKITLVEAAVPAAQHTVALDKMSSSWGRSNKGGPFAGYSNRDNVIQLIAGRLGAKKDRSTFSFVMTNRLLAAMKAGRRLFLVTEHFDEATKKKFSVHLPISLDGFTNAANQYTRFVSGLNRRYSSIQATNAAEEAEKAQKKAVLARQHAGLARELIRKSYKIPANECGTPPKILYGKLTKKQSDRFNQKVRIWTSCDKRYRRRLKALQNRVSGAVGTEMALEKYEESYRDVLRAHFAEIARVRNESSEEYRRYIERHNAATSQ